MGIPCLSYGFTDYDHFNSYQNFSIDEDIENYDFLKIIEKTR